MVIWVCEASEVNNLTVLAVGPNGHNNNNKDDNKDKIASSRSDPPMGSDNHIFISFSKGDGREGVPICDPPILI